MSIVIRAEGLGKRYNLGSQSITRHRTLIEAISYNVGQVMNAKPLRRSNTNEEFWALKDVNFDIKQGERVGIIGRNGAGKSTLLKILSRITEPSIGAIGIKGRVASLLEVGTGFHGDLTGRENIFLNGAILGMSRSEIRRKFDAIVDFAEVEKFLDTPVKRYSSGMYVRLAFAVAAHLETEILIVDEVLAVGDAEFQKKCLGKMEEVSAEEGKTVLFVSHNMGAIRSLCDKGIVLVAGKVEYQGTIDKCIEYYHKTSDHANTTKISEKIFINNTNVIIEKVLINNSLDCRFYLNNLNAELNIHIAGLLLNEYKLDVAAHLTDENGVHLGFFSPGHEKLINPTYKAGRFQLDTQLKLPSMLNKGTYYLNIILADVGREILATIKNAVEIDYEGYITKKGQVFNYKEDGLFFMQ